MTRRILPQIRTFAESDTGGMTIFGLYMTAAMAAVGAAALDVSYLLASRSHLQIAADTAAHAALYLRDSTTAGNAKIGAVEIVETQFPPEAFGEVLDPDDITFGTWDHDIGSFSPDPNSNYAVHVSTERTASRMNAVGSFLFRFVGVDQFDVAADAVFETYRPVCLTEGFVADGVVDIQSNNTYTNGFCLHSNDQISLNSNNVFEEGTIVSMPDINNIDLPSSGWDSNAGLRAALRSGSYRLRVLNRLTTIMDGLVNGDSDVIPDYIYTATPVILTATRLDASDFAPGRIHWKSCSKSGDDDDDDDDESAKGKLTIKRDTLVSGVVLVTNCEVFFESSVVLEDAIIATYNTGAKSVSSPSALQVGRDDHCADDGGAQILTMGSMDFAADLKIFGSQLIAKVDITFSANANGIEGASMVAGGEISGTSNMNMAYCGSGMDDNFEDDYFRLVD